jgi:hypothetical protein
MTKIDYKDLAVFVGYVSDFYNPVDGIYQYSWSRELVYSACVIRSNMKEYCGDSVDREWVRDLLLDTVGE